MGKRRLDSSWQGWLKENLERQCSPEELLGILLKNDFVVDSIKECMGEDFPADSALLPAEMQEKKLPSDIDYEALAKVRLTQPDSGLNVQQFLTKKLQLYIIDDFMSAEECDEIVKLIRLQLRPSEISVQPANGDKYYRTSSTCDLTLMKNKVVDKLDDKISRAIGIRLPYSEGLQGQHYEVGQEFKQHTDYFEPETAEYKRFASATGNRTWTFMIYLNNVPGGGGTRFVSLDHAFTAQKGRAVVWNNLHHDGCPNPDTLHAGLPVTEGHKDIITKWFRERGKGKMFW